MTIKYNNTTIPITPRDLDTLFRIVSCEATSDSKPDLPAADRRQERIAIVQVILERIARNLRRKSGPTTIYDVIMECRGGAFQFSPVGTSRWATTKPSTACIAAVDAALSGEAALPSPAVYYYGWTVSPSGLAAFAKGKLFVSRIGHTDFFAPNEPYYLEKQPAEVKPVATLKTAAGLVAWAKDHLGEPYWYGTYGKICDEAMLQSKAKQYPKHYTPARMPTYRKQLGKRAVDCVGLIKGYLWEDGGKIGYDKSQDTSADGMLARCKIKGDTSTLPEIPGALVFSSGHVGVYIGGGEVIEAKGFDSGVVKTQLASKSWRQWGYCPYIEYPQGAAVAAVKPTLRKGSTGAHVRALQIELGKGIAPGLAVDGDFGSKTEAAVRAFQTKKGLTVDGIVGPKTWAALGVMSCL